MLIAIFIIFALLLAYEIHSRKIEDKEEREGIPNPYANESWYINDPRYHKQAKIPVSVNIPNKKDKDN